jgi:hypothetical protein
MASRRPALPLYPRARHCPTSPNSTPATDTEDHPRGPPPGGTKPTTQLFVAGCTVASTPASVRRPIKPRHPTRRRRPRRRPRRMASRRPALPLYPERDTVHIAELDTGD